MCGCMSASATRWWLSLVALAAATAATASCASEASPPSDATSDEATGRRSHDGGSSDAGPNDAARAEVYPAPHPPVRQLTSYGGPVLARPRVVPLFYGDDSDRAKVEATLAKLPGSAYWKGLEEYGVGDVKIAPSVTMAPAAPSTFSVADIESTIAASLAKPENAAAAPDRTQIYVIFFPRQTRLLQPDGSAFCNYGGGYHESSRGRAVDFAYAVVPHCFPSFDELMVTTTHELIEAATDPYPLVTPAWSGADVGHAGFRGEVADLCDFGGKNGESGAPLFGTRVERMFSNARAKKGHDPCFPELGIPYFLAAPTPTDTLQVFDVSFPPASGRGVIVPVGKKKTIDLTLYSDREIPAWTVTTFVLRGVTNEVSSALSATVDRPTGKNGETLRLTLSRTASSAGSGDVVLIRSSSATETWLDTLYVGE